MTQRIPLFPFLLLLLLIPARTRAGDKREPPEVEVIQPTVTEITSFETFPGRIEAIQSVKIQARVSGPLMKVHFKPGAEINQGDLLFEIDSRLYQAELARADAEVRVAEARLKRAAGELERSKGLIVNRAISREDLDNASARLLEAQAELQVAQAKREIPRFNLDTTKVVAPINGKIGRALVSEGNVVNADTMVLAVIHAVAPMYVYFDIDERTALRLHALRRNDEAKGGMSVDLALPGDKEYPHQARIDFVDNRVDPKTGTLKVRAVLSNPERILLPGMSAGVRLKTEVPYKAFLVPDRAIVAYPGNPPRPGLLVVNSKSRVERREVTLVRDQGRWIVKEGLAPDDLVIVKAFSEIEPGMQVLARQVSGTPQTPTAKADQQSPQKSPAPQRGPDVAKIKELRKERSELLQTAARMLMLRYKEGRGLGVEGIVIAYRTAFEAGLECCEGPAERADTLRKQMQTAQELKRIAETMFKSGQGNQSDALQARAFVLEIQIKQMLEDAHSKK